MPLTWCAHSAARYQHRRADPVAVRRLTHTARHAQGELRARIATSGSAAQLGRPDEVLANLQNVWVLIFNPGKNDEGVYTLQGRTAPSSSYVLAFEQTDEVRRSHGPCFPPQPLHLGVGTLRVGNSQ